MIGGLEHVIVSIKIAVRYPINVAEPVVTFGGMFIYFANEYAPDYRNL